ncbi:MAG: hypothetical protein AB7F19_06860 [Candidatus Babeliales bacterium]
MKTLFLSVLLSSIMLTIQVSKGMDKGSEPKELKPRAKSYFIRRGKTDKVETRRNSASAIEGAASQGIIKKRGSFIFGQKSSSRRSESQQINIEETPDNIIEHGSQIVAAVALSKGARQSSVAQPADLPKSFQFQVQQSDGTFTTKITDVAPEKKLALPPHLRAAQITLARRANLCHVELKRTGRDSMADQSAQDLLGESGKGALLQGPLLKQSPRSDDTVTPRSSESTPRSDDSSSPRVEDAGPN